LASACASEPAQEPTEDVVDVRGAGALTLHVVPASQAVARACAAEVRTTYCSRAAAEVAAAGCAARLTPREIDTCDGRPCATTFVADARTVGACRPGPTYPSAAACAKPVAEDCAFYRTCLEAARPCGDDGYALGFGERFCHAFLQDDARFSTEGRAWLRDVRPCLQRALVPSLAERPACSEAYDRAMSSHVACYTQEAHSICDLPLGDVAHLTRVLSGELFTGRALAQMRDVGLTCAGRALSRALGLPTATSERADMEARRHFFDRLGEAAANEASFRAFALPAPHLP
jgi:hypothetical protein